MAEEKSSADLVAQVQKGYTFDGETLELGALLVDGEPDPSAKVRIPLATLNRHGLVAGATGTGKTKTLQVMAEQLSAAGVPVFLADIKGDVSGMAVAGQPSEKLAARTASVGQDWKPTSYPVEFYALGGKGTGIPVRATVTSFGPILLSKVLDLSDVQTSSLNLVFHFADKNGLPLLDIKDLRSVIQYLISEEGSEQLQSLGGLSKVTAGVLLRELIAFSDAGSFLMWLLADLFQDLPEVGDLDKPKLVFFFDEAHLLFKDASKAFLESITQTVRLIRSKGVGVFFVTQTPKDVNADVLAQLGNRVQHALRAYTPDDAKALKATASTFPHSAYDLEEVLTQLGTGEAIITVLSETGAPTPVAWTRLDAPQSLMAAADPAAMQAIVAASPLHAKYAQTVDRESAYEKLQAKLAPPAPPVPDAPAAPPAEAPRPGRPAKEEPSMVEKVLGSSATKSFLRAAATAAGGAIAREIFGTAKRRKR
jgi:DNA helicase HerA-like ATPase